MSKSKTRQAAKKPRRDKRRCIHFCGREECGLTADHCGINCDGLHLWGECGGSHRCGFYVERGGAK